MDLFDISIGFVLRKDIEGGYANDPNDPGGETMRGITVAVARANGYKGPMKDMPLDLTRKIYREKYWLQSGASEAVWPSCLHILDSAVNQGTEASTKIMQRALGINDDGVLGPKTRMNLRQMRTDHFVARFVAERLKYYATTKNFSRYGKTWVTRVAKAILAGEGA